MARVVVIDPRKQLRQLLTERLSGAWEVCAVAPTDATDKHLAAGDEAVVYHPPQESRLSATPSLEHARRTLEQCASVSVRRLVLLSSAAVYTPHFHNPGFMSEDRPTRRQRENRIARRWSELEELASQLLKGSATQLTILRPTTVPLQGDYGPLGGLFHGYAAALVAGYDPSIQLLSPEDLVVAIDRALKSEKYGIYNVAPAGVMPLRQAVRLAGVLGVPVGTLLQRAVRSVLSRLRLSSSAARTEYLRYSWTVSGDRIAQYLGFVPQRTSPEALYDSRMMETGKPPRRSGAFADRRFDDYGFCPHYYRRVGRTLGHFLEHYYWRVEIKGFDQIPTDGPAVLVGVHRGFMPFDGVLFTHQVARLAGRVPRFLIHPGLVKFPYLHDFLTKQGGVIANNVNADYTLQRGDLLALFPEGIHGAFRLYRDSYTIGTFMRDEYVRMAIRNAAPIVPFVTAGSAEIFPILGKVEWAWWKRYAEWPFIPLTPTFPLAPIPLPSKWHTQVLAPIHVERQYPPEAAADERVVRAIGRDIRGQMQAALDWMRGRRRSIFFGSIFGEEMPAETAPMPVAAPVAEVIEV